MVIELKEYDRNLKKRKEYIRVVICRFEFI
jgi:hypothetical protein